MRKSGLLFRANKFLNAPPEEKKVIVENEGVFKINQDKEISTEKPLDTDLKKLIDSVLS